MSAFKFQAILFLFNLVSTEFLSATLVVRVSKMKGIDASTCWISNTAKPCKSISYALVALKDAGKRNETEFTFLIEDHVYSLEKRIKIEQNSALRRVYLTSSNSTGRPVIRCVNKTAGIEIGTKGNKLQKTRNIYFQNFDFQNCGPRFAAAVLIWNSVDINFTSCVFSHNTQAGINAFDSGVTIESCRFVNNTSNGQQNSTEDYKEGVISAGGGAGFLYHGAPKLSLVIRDSIFESNAAVTNDSTDFIAPSSNVTHFTTGGGGLMVVFREKAENCQVLIDNSVFLNNTATYGGGIYFANTNIAIRNNYTVTNSNFTGNYAGETGGGLIFSQWDNMRRRSLQSSRIASSTKTSLSEELGSMCF